MKLGFKADLVETEVGNQRGIKVIPRDKFFQFKLTRKKLATGLSKVSQQNPKIGVSVQRRSKDRIAQPYTLDDHTTNRDGNRKDYKALVNKSAYRNTRDLLKPKFGVARTIEQKDGSRVFVAVEKFLAPETLTSFFKKKQFRDCGVQLENIFVTREVHEQMMKKGKKNRAIRDRYIGLITGKETGIKQQIVNDAELLRLQKRKNKKIEVLATFGNRVGNTETANAIQRRYEDHSPDPHEKIDMTEIDKLIAELSLP